jgi:undecaprenyl diphosphate synthase
MIKKIKMWRSRKDKSGIEERLNFLSDFPIPEHIAIIMDGNGRWAKKRALPRVAGHHEGMKKVRKVTQLANQLGVKALTLYAFSTENWKRPKLEVDYLMKLPEEFLGTFLPELIEENVRVEMMGHQKDLPGHTWNAVRNAMEATKENDGLILNFALNYGGRTEIIEAVKQVAKKVAIGHLSEDEINEELLSSYMMSPHLKDPDLLIRTSGEIRLSNFMLWQLAYSEFWFTNVLWPDFDTVHLVEAIEEFQKRSRRFGGI